MKNSKSIDTRKVWQHPIYFLAFGFGTGTLPKMPGTYGTLIAVPLYLLMMHLPMVWYGGILLVMIVAGFWICQFVTDEIQIHDYSGIVWDEIVGFLLTMFGLPIGWLWILLGFILFRIFDIWKPWPINWVNEHVKGGVGIVVDDLMAAVYAWIVLQIILKIFYK